MDFLRRDANNQPQTTRAANTATTTVAVKTDKPGGVKELFSGGEHEPKWLRIIMVGLLFSLTILAVAIALLMYYGNRHESSYVDENKKQAVFLTNGQVYFGNIVELNDDYVNLRDIYYLNTQQQPETSEQNQNSQTNFSLVKLGCELHGPTDQMVINRSQLSFWENLKSDGKVSKAIEQWVAQNPNGQNCESTTNSTQQSQGTQPNTEENGEQ